MRHVLAKTGLKDTRVETTTQNLEFESGAHLWDWLANSNPIAGEILAELGLTEEQTALVRKALDGMVGERSRGRGRGVLTSPINIGIATK